MMCYRDRTFCGYYLQCAHGNSCTAALTPAVKAGAERIGLRIAQWAEYPTCFDVSSQYEPATEEPEDAM